LIERVEMTSGTDRRFMEEALEQARQAASAGEVPVGAVVVKDGAIIARSHNLREAAQDPTAHAEILAIREAAQVLESWRLDGCTLYVTLEPCAMCTGALVLARVERCVFGASDPKGGFMGTLGDLSQHPGLNHRIEVTRGLAGEEAAELLRSFFKGLRNRKV
jgi:tRNA(adenine34) deaminase